MNMRHMFCPVWELKRGDYFRVPGDERVWRFDHMDGMYCFATDAVTGDVLNMSGNVERVPDVLSA